LIELGHRGIAFLCQELASNPGKLAGCKSALAAHGLYDSRLIFETGKEPGAVARFVAGNAELFRNVTAVVASNDLVAVEAISGLAKLGLRVPRDCSVVGYDDTQIAQAVTPTLTTVRQPREAVGANAVEMLLKRIDGKPTENVILVPELVERESTGPCRSGCGRAVAKEGGSYA
jgi:LacI family transcriptional regulator